MKKRFYLILIVLTSIISSAKSINANDTIVFDLYHAAYAANYIDIPVLFRSDEIINAVDFAFKFNEFNITYDSVINVTPNFSYLANFNLIDRKLRFTSSSLQTIPNNTNLVFVRFYFTTACGRITIADFNSLEAYLNGDPCSYLFTAPNPNINLATFTNNNSCLGQSVNFTGIPTLTGNIITDWHWNFGNGDTSIVQNPIENYTAVGSYNLTLTVTSDAGCKDTVSRIINTNVSPVASFTSTTDCSNSSVVFTDNSTISSGSIINWHYNFGDAATAIVPNPTHIYAAGGAYNVTFTVVSDSGCTAAFNNTVNITSPTANFNQPFGCAGATINFFDSTLVSSGTITNWIWYFGDGSTSTSQNPSHIYTAGGSYTASLKVTTSTGCADSVFNTVDIQAIPVVDFSADVFSGCAPLTVTFTDASTTAANSTYSWNFGDNSSSSTFNPSHLFTANGALSITEYVTTTYGCIDSLTKPSYINVNAKPVSNFTFSNSCIGAPVTFIDATTVAGSAITSWNWDLGDGTSSIIQNPTDTYSVGGPYTISLIASSAQGCIDTVSNTITIVNPPIVNFSGTNLTGCAPLPVVFTDASTTTPGSSYTWNFGDNSSSSSQNVTHTFSSGGVFNITLYVTTVEGCTDSLVKPAYVNVGGGPVAQFNTSNQCFGTTTHFIDNSTIPTGTITSWSWNFGDGNSSSQQNPNYNYAAAGTYNVQLTVANSTGCTDSFTRPIVVEAVPVVNFAADVLIGCTPLNVTFSDSSLTAFGSAYYWTLGDNSTANSMDVAHIYNSVGLYTIKHVVITPLGCKDSITKTNYINVQAPPTAYFTMSPDILKVPKATVYFTNLSNGTSSWSWNFGDSISSAFKNPSHTYLEAGKFEVCLKAFYNIGCAATYCDSVTVGELNNVAVPTAFTPNSDNINDILYIKGGPLKEVDWRIFNEWGNQVFYTDTQSEGWDGNFKGSKQPQGVYEYTLKGVTIDGTAINLYGLVNLLR